MSKPAKILAVVGANDETIAHLRLLLRMAGARLQQEWRFGAEQDADFVVVEPGSLASDTIQTHCQAAGIPFAVLCEKDDVVVQGMALRRPLKLDQIIAVFNAAGESSTRITGMQSFNDDFYTQSLGEHIPTAAPVANVWDAPEHAAGTLPATRESAVQDLDHLLFGDPLAEPVELGPMVDDSTEVAESEATERSARRRDDANARMNASLVGVSTVDQAPPTPRGPNAPVLLAAAVKKKQDDPPRPLLDYLDSELVASPTQLRLDDAPVITLDPKQHEFHAAGPLGALEAYVERGVQSQQTAKVAGAELARVRLTERARSYDELRFLTALLRSGGSLHSRLDPGGTFVVREPLELEPDYHAHGPITAAMKAPSRLHEIAQMSGASMTSVFDLVNAYDAIGRLQWTPRPPRAPKEPEKPVSALSRLKSVFGRR